MGIIKRFHRVVTVDEMRFGFLPEKGTICAAFILRRLQEEYLGKDIYLEKAARRVSW